MMSSINRALRRRLTSVRFCVANIRRNIHVANFSGKKFSYQNSDGCGLRRSARSFPRASSALWRSALASFSRDMAELI